ncbi:hypothetical protein [Thermococcus sp.]
MDMKGKSLIGFALLFSLFLQLNVLAVPYWVKPGAEIQYYANATVVANKHAWGGAMYYYWDNCIANIGFQRVKLSFQILNISDEWAFVKVSLVLYGDNSLKWPYSDIYAYYPAHCKPPFENPLNVTPYTIKNISLKWADYGQLVSLTGFYKINLATNVVYSLNGESFGHTVLFGFYPLNDSDSYIFLNNRKLSLISKQLNSTIYITYYKNFTGPNIFIISNPTNLTDPSGYSAFIRTVLVYNPSIDVSIGFMGVIPDLEASLGVYALIVSDNLINRIQPTVNNGNVEKAVAPGVILYNLTYPKEQTVLSSLHSPSRHPISNMWLLAIIGLVLLGGVLLWRR